MNKNTLDAIKEIALMYANSDKEAFQKYFSQYPPELYDQISHALVNLIYPPEEFPTKKQMFRLKQMSLALNLPVPRVSRKEATKWIDEHWQAYQEVINK